VISAVQSVNIETRLDYLSALISDAGDDDESASGPSRERPHLAALVVYLCDGCSVCHYLYVGFARLTNMGILFDTPVGLGPWCLIPFHCLVVPFLGCSMDNEAILDSNELF